jgi:hypothetical protein
MNTFAGFRSRWTISFLVCRGQPARDLDGVVDRFANGQWLSAAEALRERLALEQLRHDIGHGAVGQRDRSDVVHGEDVGMIQGRSRACLLFETLHALYVRGECRWQDFDRDLAGEALIAGAIDLAHAAHADLGRNLVRAEPSASR